MLKDNIKKRKNKILIIIFSIILFLLGSLFVEYIKNPLKLKTLIKCFDNNEALILIMGIDKREGLDNVYRSDTIILCKLNFIKNKVNIVSIPRDAYVNILNHGNEKINHAYAYGGKDLLLKTIEDNYNVKIDKFIEFDFDIFKKIVDKIGNIEIDINEDMYFPDEGINLKKGIRELNSIDSLAFVRYRGMPSADLGRIENQQYFLTQVLKKIKEKSNIFQKIDIAAGIMSNLNTNINIREAIYMLNKISNMEISTWIPDGNVEVINDISYLVFDNDINYKIKNFLDGNLIVYTDYSVFPYKKKLTNLDEKDNINNIDFNKNKYT